MGMYINWLDGDSDTIEVRGSSPLIPTKNGSINPSWTKGDSLENCRSLNTACRFESCYFRVINPAIWTLTGVIAGYFIQICKCSSIGRAADSKPAGWGFDSFHLCNLALWCNGQHITLRTLEYGFEFCRGYKWIVWFWWVGWSAKPVGLVQFQYYPL